MQREREASRTSTPESPKPLPLPLPGRDAFAVVQGLQKTAGNAAVSRMLARSRPLQRTPAAPSYGGQTGGPDPTKLTIDAGPDFVLSTLTAPHAVNPHVNDPAIKHITWEVYDAADKMVGGWSTLPGNADSTSRAFSFQASDFGPPASFHQGRYLLRLVGLDDHHKPVAYSDRDFNVLQSDQTTGTGAATGHG